MDADTIADLFSAFGAVRVKRMFGGGGVYAEGVMIALDADDILYLKADASFAAELEARGSHPFSYEAKTGRRTITSYWRLPEAAMDDPEDLATLARRALVIARAAEAAKAGKSKGGKASGTRAERGKPAPSAPRRRGAPK
ncbi:TfoX/Sxy family protein [Xanthobacter autotrophicus DSM 431]|uniref:TfoX/Sxy family protein n=1 Tax=Xanthobacter nonsaccharivorans TaxID=3119912 RepID=UPI00372B089F